MAEEQAQERTEQATPKRRREAHERGQVPRSRELNNVAVLLAAAAGLLTFGNAIVATLTETMVGSFTLEGAAQLGPEAVAGVFGQAVTASLAALFPFFGLLLAAALLASIALGGWVFSLSPMAFKWERLDPVRGLGRVFSWKGVVELIKALLKFLIVAAAALFVLWRTSDDYLGLGAAPLAEALTRAGELLGWSFLAVASALLLVVGIDVPFQVWDFNRKLRMTRQEVKDELKETEGSPDVRRRLRERQRELAARRMMAEVPKADVVVTNPDHYSVALRYTEEAMSAPTVIAKGVDHLALRIRAVAVEHSVPILSLPPLARAIYYSTDLNREIPAGLYTAVAKVLAYVYQLKRRRRGRSAPRPVLGDLPIPSELQRGE